MRNFPRMISALGFIVLFVLASCQDEPKGALSTPQTSHVSPTAPPALGMAPASDFPAVVPNQEEAADPERLSALLERARLRQKREARKVEGPTQTTVNVASATGAHPRTTQGDYQRFLALEGKGKTLEINRHQPLIIYFDKPVVPVHAIGAGTTWGLWISPETEGRLVWTATDTLTFAPSEPLTPGTTYHVRLEEENALNATGTRLVQDFAWRFRARDDRRWLGDKLLTHTPIVGKPMLMGRWPDMELDAEQDMMLIFDQPVTPEMIAKHLTFIRIHDWGQARKQSFDVLPFELTQPRRNPVLNGVRWPARHTVHVVPSEPLERGQHAQLKIEPALLDEGEGAWWLTFLRAHHFELTGLLCRPSGCTERSCSKPCEQVGEIDAETHIELAFTNDVLQEEGERRIAIKPAPLKRWDYGGYAEHHLELGLQPGKDYVFTIDGGLEDYLGHPLKESRRLVFHVADLPPHLEMKLFSGSMEVRGPQQLPIEVRNVPQVEVLLAQIPRDALASWVTRPLESWNKPPLPQQGLRYDFEGLEVERYVADLASSRNVLETTALDVKPMLKGRTGVFLLEVSSTEGEADSNRVQAMIQVTDLGLTLRYSHDDGLLAWVTSLSTGKPVAGAMVELQNAQNNIVSVALSDRDGVARFEALPSTVSPLVVFAHLGMSDGLVGANSAYTILRTYGDMYRGLGESLPSSSRMNRVQSPSDRLLVELFTERGIYRPGQQVFVKAYVRERLMGGNLRPQPGKSVQLLVNAPDGSKIVDKKLTLNAYGAIDSHFELETGALVGWYRCELRMDGKQVGWSSFQVEEYRAPEFEVLLSTKRAASEDGVEKQNPSVTVEGRYLFGAPMSGASLEWSWERSPALVYGDGLTPFSFHDPRVRNSRLELNSGRETLGTDGLWTFDIVSDYHASKRHGPWSYQVVAEVQDVDRQAVSKQTRLTVHDRDAYLGIDISNRFYEGGEPLWAHVVAIDNDYTRLSGVKGQVRLFRREWHTNERRGPGGSYYKKHEEILSEESGCQVRTAAEPVKCQLKPRKTGEYLVVVEGQDRQGRPLFAGTELYVEGEGYVPWKAPEAKPNAEPSVGLVPHRDGLGLVAEQLSYNPGDTAKILVKSPWEHAWALVTVEQEGIHDARVVWLDGSSRTIEVPITQAMSPKVVVHVVTVRGRVGDELDGIGRDKMAPHSHQGSVELRVYTKHHRLDVDVKAVSSASPGESVTIDLSVTEAVGDTPVEAELALWVVDEAVLQLTHYTEPYLEWKFNQTRYDRVKGQDTRGDLLANQMALMEMDAQGGDGAQGRQHRRADPEQVRRTFQTTPLFLGSLVTGADGKAQARVTLPDNLTQFRVIATAADKGQRFGVGRDRIRVSKPLMIRPALPRFLRLGDTVELAATIFNGTKEAGVVAVNLTAEGVEATNVGLQHLPLKAGEMGEVRFKASAEVVGKALFRFEATLKTQQGEQKDKVEVRLPIHYPGQWIDLLDSGFLEDAHTFAMKLDALGVEPGAGHVELSVSSTLLTSLSGSLDYLVRYPYGCVEQTTSGLLPLLAMRDQIDALGLEIGEHELDVRVKAGVKRLLSMRTSNGGLAYWPGGWDAHVFGTAYGALALTAAKEAGFSISDEILVSMGDFLHQKLADALDDTDQIMDATSRAMMLYALARLGRHEPSWIARFSDDRSTISTAALAFIVMAAHTNASPVLELLVRELEHRFVREGAKVVLANPAAGNPHAFDSDDRTIALALMALSQAKPSSPKLHALAMALVEQRRNGRWSDTQATLWGLWAMVTYADRVERGEQAAQVEVRVGKRKELGDVHFSWPLARFLEQGSQTLTVVPEEGRRLYYTLKARYLRRASAQDLKPKAHGLQVYRSYLGADGAVIAGALPAGEVVQVRLVIDVAEDAQYVAVDDPLPAGLEPINLRLATNVSHSLFNSGQEHFNHIEQRDDRVLFFADRLPKGIYALHYLARATSLGTFTVAPARAHLMYRSDVYGSSALTRVDVR